jgi:hypothetical protein
MKVSEQPILDLDTGSYSAFCLEDDGIKLSSWLTPERLVTLRVREKCAVLRKFLNSVSLHITVSYGKSSHSTLQSGTVRTGPFVQHFSYGKARTHSSNGCVRARKAQEHGSFTKGFALDKMCNYTIVLTLM